MNEFERGEPKDKFIKVVDTLEEEKRFARKE